MVTLTLTLTPTPTLTLTLNQVRRQLTPKELVGGGKASSPAAYLQAAEAAEAAEVAEAASDPKGTKAKAAEAIQARVRGRQARKARGPRRSISSPATAQAIRAGLFESGWGSPSRNSVDLTVNMHP